MSRTLGATALVILVFSAGIANAQPERPLPLDPLTLSERASADSIVRSDPRVREFLAGGPSRLINLDFIAVKTPRESEMRTEVPPSRRTAEALLYRYDTNQGIRVLVDFERRAVTDLVRIPGESVPINNEEVAQAAKIALADRRVIQLFGGRMPAFRVATGPATLEEANQPRIEGLRTIGVTAEDPCYRRRCVVLFFRVNNQYVQMNRVFVDLISQRVIIREGEQ
jgi:Cu2+-containing amine oxidase